MVQMTLSFLCFCTIGLQKFLEQFAYLQVLKFTPALGGFHIGLFAIKTYKRRLVIVLQIFIGANCSLKEYMQLCNDYCCSPSKGLDSWSLEEDVDFIATKTHLDTSIMRKEEAICLYAHLYESWRPQGFGYEEFAAFVDDESMQAEESTAGLNEIGYCFSAIHFVLKWHSQLSSCLRQAFRNQSTREDRLFDSTGWGVLLHRERVESYASQGCTGSQWQSWLLTDRTAATQRRKYRNN